MAGSPCPDQVMRNVIDRMHMSEVAICYGMTETSPVSTQTLPTTRWTAGEHRRPGRPAPGDADRRSGDRRTRRAARRASCAPGATA